QLWRESRPAVERDASVAAAPAARSVPRRPHSLALRRTMRRLQNRPTGTRSMAIPHRRTSSRKSHIIRDPKVLGGEPSVRGTRISVRSIVLAAREYVGVPGVLTAYPHLNPAAVE